MTGSHLYVSAEVVIAECIDVVSNGDADTLYGV